MTPQENLIIDGALSAHALMLPFWVQVLSAWTTFGITIGTLFLVALRLILAIREWQNK